MQINLPVPDYSTVSRRLDSLKIKLPVKKKKSAQRTCAYVVKMHGEGKWRTRQHGISKRIAWRKLHLGIDKTQRVRADRRRGRVCVQVCGANSAASAAHD